MQMSYLFDNKISFQRDSVTSTLHSMSTQVLPIQRPTPLTPSRWHSMNISTWGTRWSPVLTLGWWHLTVWLRKVQIIIRHRNIPLYKMGTCHIKDLPNCLNFEIFSLASSSNVNGTNTPSSSISSFGSLIMIFNFLAWYDQNKIISSFCQHNFVFVAYAILFLHQKVCNGHDTETRLQLQQKLANICTESIQVL